ncbi:polysaccharide deacetylase family protein [Clostridium sp.]|uniref:polysaccharide deacetylase family protein n=1 Tax=Clostridium sp. TaxID=1506 RepID=UPI003D6CE3BC
MNKKKSLKIFKNLLMISVVFVAFFLSAERFLKKTNTIVENKGMEITKTLNNDTTIMKDKKLVQSNQILLRTKKKEEEKKHEVIDIKMNEKRIGEKTKASVNRWKNSIIKLSKRYPDKIIVKGKGDKKIVALTFDDGPDRDVTPKIIDELKKHNAKGTFFFEGDRIQHNEDVVQKAFKYGNQIAGHSFSHPMFTKESKEEIIREMTKTNNLINSSIGKSPVFFRPPYGDIDENTLSYLDENCIAIIWSLDTFDWVKGTQAAEIAKFVMDSIEPEAIILMHSTIGKNETLKALPLIIKGLKEKGYEFVTVSEMLGANAYK